MKQLQKNYTTPEQSKRLLELGVPADSADCAMFPYDETFKQYELRVISFNKIFSTYEIYNEDGTIYPGKIPCWSVGRLIEIYETCTPYTCDYNRQIGGTQVERIMTLYERASKSDLLDFLKLED